MPTTSSTNNDADYHKMFRYWYQHIAEEEKKEKEKRELEAVLARRRLEELNRRWESEWLERQEDRERRELELKFMNEERENKFTLPLSEEDNKLFIKGLLDSILPKIKKKEDLLPDELFEV